MGTDDGLIQITEDGGNTWRKISAITGAPKQSYVNNVYCSRHDANVLYVAFNHHKYGDFKPYIFTSTDKGNTWRGIAANLPERGSVYAIEEDPIDRDLIFCGTEFGVFFSPNKGLRWKELSTGMPTIAVRDMAIQERENDLVLATFGRGFYVMDDYSSLRTIENVTPTQTALIYPVRDALVWEQSSPLGLPGKSFQGDNFYSATNLGPEAMITFYYKEDYKTLKEKRTKREEELIKGKKDAYYPSYEALKAEKDEEEAQLLFTIKNADGLVVKKEFKKPAKGVQRFHWDLRFTPQDPVDLSTSSFYNPFAGKDEGTLVAPGTYSVTMQLAENGVLTDLAGPVPFKVVALENTTLPAEDRNAKVAFQRDVSRLQADLQVCENIIKESKNKLKYIKAAIKRSEQPYGTLAKSVLDIENKFKEVGVALYGDPVKYELDISQPQTASTRIGIMGYEQKYSTSAPTKTHKDNYTIARAEIDMLKKKVETLFNSDIKQLEEQLIKSGAPYTPGRGYENKE